MTTFNQFLGATMMTEARFDGHQGSPILPAGRGSNSLTRYTSYGTALHQINYGILPAIKKLMH